MNKSITILLLGLWLGCACFFAFVVAPTLFNPDVATGLSRPMAGAISGALLKRVYLLSYVCLGLSFFSLLLGMVGRQGGGTFRALIFVSLALGLNASNDLWIHDQMSRIKVARANSPQHEERQLDQRFDWWHKVSRGVYVTMLISGGIAVLSLLPAGGGGKSRGKQKK